MSVINAVAFNTFNRIFLDVLASRKVNPYEYQLFKKLGNAIIRQPLLVTTIDEFVLNLNNRFHYQHWSIYIDFNKFRLGGGSVLLCMLRFFDQPITSDLDFFYVGENLDDFLDSLVSEIFVYMLLDVFKDL